MQSEYQQSEKHPLDPFIPEKARILMLGSFPPSRKRWSMEFFYPNWINDMWRITGIVFYGDKEHFIYESGIKEKAFDRNKIEAFCNEKGIALYDAACEVRRLRENASDKYLEVVKNTDILSLLGKMPDCRAIVTTGQKASEIICGILGCDLPAIGESTEIVIGKRTLRFWRMPSSSRAYPLPLEKKAETYRKMYEYETII